MYLTAQLVFGTGNHVVEDVKGSFYLCLSDTARLLQQVWEHSAIKEYKRTLCSVDGLVLNIFYCVNMTKKKKIEYINLLNQQKVMFLKVTHEPQVKKEMTKVI